MKLRTLSKAPFIGSLLLLVPLTGFGIPPAFGQSTETDSPEAKDKNKAISKILNKIRPGKWNVCGATLNSADEMYAFKKALPGSDWNFIELTDFAKIDPPKKIKKKEINVPSSEDWLKNACESQVRCDVLVVSGHHTAGGRKYYGSTPYSLSSETLQSYACSETCKGILTQPVEVYLMGCNSLNESCGAGISAAQASEVKSALIKKGMERNEAEGLVQALQASVTKSVKETVKEDFYGVRNIVGWQGTAPAGGVVWRPLYEALKELEHTEKGGYRQYLENHLTGQGFSLADQVHANTYLSKHILDPNLRQCSAEEGFISDSFEARKAVKKNTCSLLDTRSPLLDRLKFAKMLADKNLAIDYLPAIAKLSESIQVENLKPEELEVFNALKNDTALRAQILAALDVLPFDSLFGNTLDFSQKVGWITKDEVEKRVTERLHELYSQPFFTEEGSLYACRFIQDRKIDLKSIPLSKDRVDSNSNLFSSNAGLVLLSCTHAQGAFVDQKLVAIAAKSPITGVREKAADLLISNGDLRSNEVIDALSTFAKDKNAEVRNSFFYSLDFSTRERMTAIDPVILRTWIEKGLSDKGEEGRTALVAATQVFRYFREDPSLTRSAETTLLNHINDLDLSTLKEAGNSYFKEHPDFQKRFQKALEEKIETAVKKGKVEKYQNASLAQILFEVPESLSPTLKKRVLDFDYGSSTKAMSHFNYFLFYEAGKIPESLNNNEDFERIQKNYFEARKTLETSTAKDTTTERDRSNYFSQFYFRYLRPEVASRFAQVITKDNKHWVEEGSRRFDLNSYLTKHPESKSVFAEAINHATEDSIVFSPYYIYDKSITRTLIEAGITDDPKLKKVAKENLGAGWIGACLREDTPDSQPANLSLLKKLVASGAVNSESLDQGLKDARYVPVSKAFLNGRSTGEAVGEIIEAASGTQSVLSLKSVLSTYVEYGFDHQNSRTVTSGVVQYLTQHPKRVSAEDQLLILDRVTSRWSNEYPAFLDTLKSLYGQNLLTPETLAKLQKFCNGGGREDWTQNNRKAFPKAVEFINQACSK